jgi:predicted nucleic acid-binding protein
MEAVYIDSNIFIYHLFEPDYHWANSFLRNVEEGKYCGVVSHLTILETISRGRRLLTENTRLTQKEVNDQVLEGVKIFWAMKNLEIAPENTAIDLKCIFDDALNCIQKYQGRLIMVREKKVHKGMYAADVIHLAIAKKVGCKRIVTSDGDFREIDPAIEKISVLNLN